MFDWIISKLVKYLTYDETLNIKDSMLTFANKIGTYKFVIMTMCSLQLLYTDGRTFN